MAKQKQAPSFLDWIIGTCFVVSGFGATGLLIDVCVKCDQIRALQHGAVERGVAEWTVDEHGKAHWSWKASTATEATNANQQEGER